MAWIDRVLRLAALSADGRSMVLDHAGALAFTDGKYASARRYFEASVDLRRKCDSKRPLALSLTHLAAAVRWGNGDAIESVALYEESLTLAEEVGDRLLMGAAPMPLGTLALDRGALDEAQALLRKGLAMYIELQLEVALPLALEQFAALAAAQGYLVRALRLSGAGTAWRRKLDTLCDAVPHLDGPLSLDRANDAGRR
jgi:tetratricopeptide (TPR) repeat protein